MKIEKLITLSEFVDEVQKKFFNPSIALGLIIAYNNFLKQPLKREMFANQESYSPKAWKEGIGNSKAWQEAEKKVIFNKNLEHLLKFNPALLTIATYFKNNPLPLKNVEI